MYKRKWKSFIICDRINVLAKVDVHTGTYVDLVLQLILSVLKVNTIVKTVKHLKQVTSSVNFLQAMEITKILTSGGTEIFSCCIV